MLLKKVPVLLLVVCLVLLTACSPEQKSKLQRTASTAVGYFSTLFDEISEKMSVRSLEDSNCEFKEPDYVDWQTARHYYLQLSEKEQLAYRCIYNCVFGQPERIAVPTLGTDELNAVFTALRYDNPQLLFLDDNASLLTAGMYCYFIPTYILSYWDARDIIVRCAEAAENILNQAEPTATQFEILLTAHDALCEECIYGDLNVRSGQCDGALLQNIATCAGYAKALKLILDIAGVDCCTVTGNVPDESGATVSHMWLAVCTDGNWSYCDPTWDDPVAEDGRQTVEHGYFCVPHERLSLTHADIEKPPHIVCDNESTDYFVYKNLFCTQENYSDIILNGIMQALQDEKEFAEFRFDSAHALKTANEELIESDGVYELLAEASPYNDALLTNRIGYSVDEKRLQLKLIFAFEE